MPNILAAIGQASPAIRQTMTDIEERPQKALRWGWEQEQYGQQKAINQMDIEKMQNDLLQRKKIEEEYNQPFDIQTISSIRDLDQATKNQMIEDFQKAGITDEKGVGKRGKIVEHFKMLQINPETFAPYIELETEGRRTNYFKIQEQLDKEMEKPGRDPAKVADLEGKLEVAKESYQKSLKRLDRNKEEQKFVNNLHATKSHIRKLQESGALDNFTFQEKNALILAAGAGSIQGMQDVYEKIIAKKEATEKNANIHFETDEKGNTVKIVSDPISGETIRRENIGKIGKGEKPEKPEKPSDFDKKWVIATSIAKEKKGSKPTQEEIAIAYKANFGSNDFLSTLLGQTQPTINPSGYVFDPIKGLTPKK